jgi:hypothetical protein
VERRTEPVSEPRAAHRDVTAVVLAVAVIVGLALLKPWGPPNSGGTAEPGMTLPTSAIAEATPSPTPMSEESLVAGFCLQPAGWRIFTTEHWSDRDVRVWRTALAFANAVDATDTRIPMTPVASRSVTTLGFCAPVSGPDRPPIEATVTVYRRDPGEPPTILAVRRVQPAARPSALGSVFSPPLSKNLGMDDEIGWVSGVYVFRVGAFTPGAYVRWLGVTVEILPGPRPSPTTEN